MYLSKTYSKYGMLFYIQAIPSSYRGISNNSEAFSLPGALASSFKGGGGLEENLRGACKVSRGEAHQVAFVEAAGRFASAYEIGSVRLLLRQHSRQLSNPKVPQYGSPISPCHDIGFAQLLHFSICSP